ncbi:MAG: hypothetical protein KY468_03205 [Armatimonadetes bacterium]|nr:hypothetical protein [Armatimonadota bacterium]
MPKSKLRSHHNGHALTRGKGSIYQRNMVKREDERSMRRENDSSLPASPADPPSPS